MARVLIVDDSQSDRFLMRAILEEAGHELLLAENGERALKLYLRHPLDVIVTDIQMPRGDGLELITALKGLYPDVPIIAVSAHGLDKLEIAQSAGARSILTKPLDRERFIRAVEEATTPQDEGPAD